MDKVVQQVAATAEESAAASEEMNSQALDMDGIVKELTILVTGLGNRLQSETDPSSEEMDQNQVALQSTVADRGWEDAVGSQEGPANQHPASSLEWAAEEVNPEQVIPLKDEDLKNF